MRIQEHPLTRRAVLCGLVAWPVSAWAHAGHGSGLVVADADTGWVRGNRIKLVLTLFNSGADPVTLQAVMADGAARVPVANGLVAPGAIREVTVIPAFDGAVPGLFTALLDFGQDGIGPVAVMR